MIKHFKSTKVTCVATLISLGISTGVPAFAQKKKRKETAPVTTPVPKDSTVRPPMGNLQAGPKTPVKKFSELITSRAKADSGLFNIYKQDDRIFLELADSLLGRDILVVNRISKSAAGLRAMFYGYGGDQIGENMIRFEKGPNNRIFLKNISYSEISKDSTMPMFNAVMNSNIQPIAAAFDVKAFSENGRGAVIDLTEFISSDNEVLNFSAQMKSMLKLGGAQGDKSYIVDVKSFPINIEIKTVKTYSRSGGGAPGMPPTSGGNATLELNSSMVLLPAKPMQPRYYDPRVGYFTTSVTDFDADPQGVKRLQMATRWRLEPKPGDLEKYKRGELVEPIKPIVFYIDPATPAKWRSYLIQGVNDWQTAFEQAGFKNAVVARMAPTAAEDSTWSLEDARFSAIVYKPSDIANASGPHVHDPRSGEILESHINWYHNVMKLLRNWYMVQASPNDERARKIEFDDELMGELIRFVSSHEVGHTLGLRHNFGSSSTYPTEKLRDKAWTKEHGFAASIMDYARFNYVAQPGDGITGKDLYPRINYYDKWAIEWGYRLIPEAKSAADESSTLNKWTMNKLQDKRYWFGREGNPDDPRAQNEDLGDDAVASGRYGIKNLQYIIPNLLSWTRTKNEGYANLMDVYKEVTGQYGRYMGHVAKSVGGIYETPKYVEQAGGIFEPVPKVKQQQAVQFLQQQLFVTPKWLLNKDIIERIGVNAPSLILALQEPVLDKLVDTRTLTNLLNAEAISSKTYQTSDLMNDVRKGIFSELSARKPIDIYRRNLQKAYVNKVAELLSNASAAGNAGGMRMPGGGAPAADPSRSDISSIARAQLVALRSEIRVSVAGISDNMSRYHLNDLIERINKVLDPK